jgi:hypothetical protein
MASESERIEADKRLTQQTVMRLLAPHQRQLNKVYPRWHDDLNTRSSTLSLYIQDEPAPNVIMPLSWSLLSDAINDPNERRRLERLITEVLQTLMS